MLLQYLKLRLFPLFLFLFSILPLTLNSQQDYEEYHLKVLEAEAMIAQEEYAAALLTYEELFEQFDFIFLREYQVASQLAAYNERIQKTEEYLKKGIRAGWTKKSIKKNAVLAELWKKKGQTFKYKNLRDQYLAGLNVDLRKQVKKMIAKDQKKAIRALFALGPKAQDRYAEKKFAPHSERQMAELRTILKQHSYPGERLIGHDTYMSTILSHHNSISQDYNQRDSIYPTLKPQLWAAVLQGYLYPYDFALIDEWYRSVKQGHDKAFYGILNPPNTSELGFTNQLRKKVLIRSVELRNKLVEVEEKTGMNFYLKGAPWIKGKIKIYI